MSSALEISIDTEASNVNIAQYLAVATVALFVYEYLITLDDEIRLLWSSRRHTIVKTVLIINRYAPFVTSFLFLYAAVLFRGDFELCKPIAILIGYLSYTSAALSGSILFLRIYTLWERKKKILIFLLSLFTSNIVIIFAVLCRVSESFEEISIRPYDSGCVLLLLSKLGWIPFFILLTQEIILLLLIMMKDVKFHHDTNRRLVKALIKDGQLYYCCMIVVTIANLQVNSLVPNPPPFYGVVLEAVLHNILCIRLSIHLVRVHDSATRVDIGSGEGGR